MPTEFQSRAQFLALARFCQDVISSLYDYLAGAELNRKALDQVLGALESVESGDPYRFGRPSATALNSYEQLRTLEQVWKKDQITEAVRLTKALSTGNLKDEAKKQDAKALLELFSRLQTKALWNFEQPSQTPPPDLRALCEALKAV